MCSFFFNDTATTEIYTLSLHDALPICHRAPGPQERGRGRQPARAEARHRARGPERGREHRQPVERSEEHTSELQSRQYLVCRLLLEKKNRQWQTESRRMTFLVCASTRS